MRSLGSWLVGLGVLGIVGAVICFFADAAVGPFLLLLGLAGVIVGGAIRLAFMRGTSGGTGGDGAFGGGGL